MLPVRHAVSAALRSLRRHPGFTGLAVLTLGLGIGASVTVFSVGNAVLLRPLPYPDAETLVTVNQGTVEGIDLAFSRLELPLLREQTHVFEAVAARSSGPTDVTFQVGDAPLAHARGLMVSYDYLSVLKVRPLLGRTFVLEDAMPPATPEEGEEVAPEAPGIVVTYDFWRRALGEQADLAKVSFRIADRPFRIIGVLPPDFRVLHERSVRWMRGTDIDFFAVLPEPYFTYPGPRTRNVLLLARLQPGVEPRQAEAALDGAAARLRGEEARYEREQLRILVHRLREQLTAGSRPTLLMLSGGVVFLMLLVCANLANLMLVRERIRSSEDAVRTAVGCGRGRLFCQRLAESVILVLLGGVVGLAFAAAAIELLGALAPPTVPLLDEVALDPVMLLLGLGAVVLLTILFGGVAAVQVGRLHPLEVLKSDAPGAGHHGRQKLMSVLVVSELALSLVLLAGAAVMAASLAELSKVDLGYDADRVLTFTMLPYAAEFRSMEARATLYAELDERLEAIPGVEAVARTGAPPLGGVVWNAVYGWDDESWIQGSERAELNVCTQDYFEALGTRLLAGRFFTDAEMTDSTESIIVDEKLARIAWPDEDPIGQRLRWRLSGEGVVVGVVEHLLMRDFGVESIEAIHMPEGIFWPGRARFFAVRSRIPPQALIPSIRRVLRSVHPTLVPYNVTSLEDRVGQSMAPTRFVVFLMTSFAVIAILIAVTGLFGVIAYAVRSRTAELGIRMALGADRGRILSLVLRQGAGLTVVGIVAGVAGALLLSRFLQGMVFGISPTDPTILTGIALVLGLVSVLACYAPARWACRVDPVEALRAE